MRYVKAQYDLYQEEKAYRIYISDSIFYYADNKRLSKRYYDYIQPKKQVETRSGDEIAMEVMHNLGLKME